MPESEVWFVQDEKLTGVITNIGKGGKVGDKCYKDTGECCCICKNQVILTDRKSRDIIGFCCSAFVENRMVLSGDFEHCEQCALFTKLYPQEAMVATERIKEMCGRYLEAIDFDLAVGIYVLGDIVARLETATEKAKKRNAKPAAPNEAKL